MKVVSFQIPTVWGLTRIFLYFKRNIGFLERSVFEIFYFKSRGLELRKWSEDLLYSSHKLLKMLLKK